MELEGSVSVVTGGASGIGRATAIALAAQGAEVVVADIDGPGAEAVASQVGGPAIQADLAERTEVERVVRESIAWKGRVDVYISNAGIGCEGDAHAFSVADWERMVAVDLMASVWAMRLLVPHMLGRGHGHISFVTSIWGYEANAALAPYCVAKFGLVGLAESLARQLKDSGVEVSLIVPGAVLTRSGSAYVYAGAEGMTAEELAERRAASAARAIGAPPETMAATIVEGIAAGRFHILQETPTGDDWLGDTLRRKAADPDAFVLG